MTWVEWLVVACSAMAVMFGFVRLSRRTISTGQIVVERFVREITPIRRDHASIFASIRALAAASGEAVYTTDETGRIKECNAAYLELWGFNRLEEAQSDDWLSQLTDESKRTAAARLRGIVSRPDEFDYDMHHIDGRILRVQGFPIVDEGDGLWAPDVRSSLSSGTGVSSSAVALAVRVLAGTRGGCVSRLSLSRSPTGR